MRLGRALTATTLALAIAATAACSGSSQAGDPEPSASTTAAAPTPSPASGPTLDPAHAVDPPGRRTGQIAPADIVVNGAETIPQEKVDEIRELRGVQDIEQISLVQIPVENRSLSVAAVDPGTYRNWITDAADAQLDEAWQRVAAGELAIPKATVRRLPVDDTGFLALGSTRDAPRVHVGAYTQQSWLVDAVVNDTWVPTLGMTEGNALLIRTGDTAPEPLRKPIQQILDGTDATVSMTDAVARNGLDPGVVQTAVVVGTIADAVGTYRYSVLSGGRIAPDPAWVREHIVTSPVPILGNVTCNKLLIPQLRAALEDVVAQGLADEIHPDEYAGCYYPRFIAGSTTLSNHAFGLALDFNVPGNQRGTVGEIDRGVVAIFKRWGFAWGGDWSYTDPMHFEMNRLVAPR
ncbi:M15 family metallopeptidase [Nocardioides caricicola]|uniref:M15 family metallopeptidase n=1 Tax=Nocardioides caricicola TaxID=634770 RepID=A0ABW0N0T8_9ACTN